MITLVRNSTNYLRALVLYENGAPVTGATVTGTISQAYGDPLPGLENIPLLPVPGYVTYNYQATIQPAQIDVDHGVKYEVEVRATLNDFTIRGIDTVQVTE